MVWIAAMSGWGSWLPLLKMKTDRAVAVRSFFYPYISILPIRGNSSAFLAEVFCLWAV
jgi:hypothetical protein